MDLKKILLLAICLSCISNAAQAIGEIPAGVMDAAGSAGNLNVHDMDRIRDLERRKEQEEDWKELKKRQKEEQKKEQQVDKIEKKQKKNVIKARAEEYATKGVYIDKIRVAPSEILTEDEIENIITPYLGENLSFEQIKEIVAKINNLYMEKGFVTARAFVPEQTIDEGTIYIDLLEGKVGDVTVTGNRWTKESYIKKRISAKPYKLFDIVELEQNVLNFNKYTDGIDLNANLKPGEKRMGTTDIELTAKEKLPFHTSLIFDNAGRSTIGKFRGGVALTHDSLFGYRDKLTLGAYFSAHSNTPFADYNIPVNKKDGRVGFSFSSSYAHIAKGPYEMFNIRSRSYVYSLYFNQPIIRKPYMELSSFSSVDYKQATTSFDGYDLNTDKITSARTGLNLRYDTKRGIWYANQYVSYAMPIFRDNSNYVKLEGGIVRLHDFGHGIVGQFRGNYQAIPKDVVPYIDQFQAGGLSSVRGYSEGLLIGRSGYLLSGELLFPIAPSTIKTKDKKKEVPFLGKYVKGVAFVDHAMVFPFKGDGPGAPGYDANDVLLGIGMGLRVSLPKDITARLYWGFPMIRNSHEPHQQAGRFHFDIVLTPDYDALVKLRKPKQQIKKQTDEVQNL
ncbi:TPA: ShlB/FhaC/HecB family hemolysin secretion/activation protein [Candidatus Scatousia excrementigallinarum]|uniref:ShlB/FhaC/HecB family hemolysin secretion/activation protein n=1 Tax=Candidatus Scatousia excrementigallinarum TaxID=2840935 RepID=A0A9D1F085_9BACT|nr:ShlB/FhaC/HecB family hemolysin secretion/activation protein [Candidatus Scatousia excrementigallinarum]